ncbi:HAD-IA family hydrolase [Methylovirgula sp. 4M-Z18]|uniref:HAD-IA family hydrolase n=1 Tax=Methylovirgula sp. 4M-Z18 TaxID=2293567 RepID=UPI000E2F8510|nr:HAD-IA family hydrolase [Methylovirgula sp. 4M-Z18]RFB80159.1 HAD family hydrolase [Methylovirgula sp. 4M-Z18]
MTGTPPLLVFDLDGTLAETAGDLFAALNVVLAQEGCPQLPVEEARSLLGAGGRVLIQRGLAEVGRSVTPERLEELFSLFLAHYNAHIADHSFLFPGLVPSLDKFEQAGWGFSICTNKMEQSAHKLMKALGAAHRFRFICGQDTFGVGKPNPLPLIKTIEASGGTLRRSIMIGDSRTDIDTAKAAGIPVVAVDFGYTDLPVATFNPDKVISHFDDLWDAVAEIELVTP